jgi:hypothetical protein
MHASTAAMKSAQFGATAWGSDIIRANSNA